MEQHRRLLLILRGIVAVGPLSINMYLPSLPTLQAHSGADAAAVQFILSIFFIGLTIGQIFYGPVSDRIGRPLHQHPACQHLSAARCVGYPPYPFRFGCLTVEFR